MLMRTTSQLSAAHSSRPTTRPRTGRSISRGPNTRGRPRTAHSRPLTARPVTAASVRREASYVVALLEGRGVAREIGIAALDRDTGKVMIVQLADCQTYVKTLHQLHLYHPSLILVPDTFLSSSENLNGGRRVSSSLLVEVLQEEFPAVPLEPIGRKYWNENGGLDFLVQLCVEDDERAGTILAASNKYYALSAICALFKYAEVKLNTRFAHSSLRISYVPVDGTMMVDPDTAKNLELVGNLGSKKSTHSLFGLLNHTYTPMAARLLRVNLLSPLATQLAINARLDAVQELVQTETIFTDVRDALKTFSKVDFDKLIVSLASEEAQVTSSAKVASTRVLLMLNLRKVVKNLPILQKALGCSRSRLLKIVQSMISDERLEEVDWLVSASLNDDCMPVKGGIGAVNARVYAVKAQYNRLLDVARETYKENVGDIFQLSRSLSETHDLPLSLLYQDTGFVFTLKKTDMEGELPDGFVDLTMKKGKWLFSSLELKKLNARMKDALDETLILSEKIIHELAAEVTDKIGALYRASEAVALCDMLWSFAHASIIRPEFTGTFAVKSGRHPVLETVQSAGSVVANDVYCDDSSSFQLIQGPKYNILLLTDVSALIPIGKSTYLKQIGLLTVMAMCGCFVPAEYASFRIHDMLLSRLSNDDDLEKSLSTFASEMATSAMILGLATPNSLVLIDELGRGTSPREGVGIAHAIAEGLIELKSFVFFATHFKELVTTLSRKPTVVNLHLSVYRNKPSAANFGLAFQYRVVDGVSGDMGHYGLDLARLADLPEDALNEAKAVAESLTALETKTEEESETNKIAARRKGLLRLKTQLAQALDHSALPDQELFEYVRRFQAEIAKVFLNAL